MWNTLSKAGGLESLGRLTDEDLKALTIFTIIGIICLWALIIFIHAGIGAAFYYFISELDLLTAVLTELLIIGFFFAIDAYPYPFACIVTTMVLVSLTRKLGLKIYDMGYQRAWHESRNPNRGSGDKVLLATIAIVIQSFLAITCMIAMFESEAKPEEVVRSYPSKRYWAVACTSGDVFVFGSFITTIQTFETLDSFTLVQHFSRSGGHTRLAAYH